MDNNKKSKQKITKMDDNMIEGSKVVICAEVRTLDSTGRMVIPRKYRDVYGLHKLTEIEIIPLESGIMIRPHNRSKGDN